MTYAIGDPDHIEVHESIRLLFMAAGLDPDLIPGTATIGATGHVDDHNRIADALAWLDENGIPGPPWVVVNEGSSTGVTFSTLTDPDGDGKNYRLATMTSNCTLVVTTEGKAQRMLISGGSGGNGDPNNHGNGGIILDGEAVLEAGTHSVVIGAGGAASAASTGGTTKIGTSLLWATGAMGQSGSFNSRAGYRPSLITSCYASSITGTSTYYGITPDSFSTANGSAVPRTNRGDAGGLGGSTAGAGSSGVAYIRWEI